MGDLNAKVGFDNILFGHVMEKHGFASHNHNGDRFVAFRSLHRLVRIAQFFKQFAIRSGTRCDPYYRRKLRDTQRLLRKWSCEGCQW